MKIDRFDLILEEPEGANCRQYFLAGDEIKGIISVDVRGGNIRIARLSLRLIGTSYTGWQDEFANVYESRELFLEEYKDLTSELSLFCNEAMEILWGEHKVNFKIKLPIEAISSIEKDGFGCVRYSLVATLDISEDGGDSEIVAESELPVYSFLSLDAPHFLDSVQSTEQTFIRHPWMCRDKSQRRIIATLCVSTLGLLPGETCTLSLSVENTIKKARLKKHTGDHHECGLISLCQQIDFRARAKLSPHIWDRRSITTAVQSFGICKANVKAGPEIKEILFKIPTELPPSSAKKNGLIVCSYFFRIEIEENFDVIVPVVIGSHKSS